MQNEVNCMNDSEDFQDAESVRSGNSHVTSRPVSFPPHPIPEGMAAHKACVYSPSLMSWTKTTRTAAEEQGHPDSQNSSIGYEPIDHFITEG